MTSSSTAARAEVCKGRAKQIEEHHHTLYGNGKPGLKTQVERLEGKLLVLWCGAGAGAAAGLKAVLDLILK